MRKENLYKPRRNLYAENMGADEKLDGISYIVIGLAIEVHKQLGPGLLESAYQECLYYKIKKA